VHVGAFRAPNRHHIGEHARPCEAASPPGHASRFSGAILVSTVQLRRTWRRNGFACAHSRQWLCLRLRASSTLIFRQALHSYCGKGEAGALQRIDAFVASALRASSGRVCVSGGIMPGLLSLVDAVCVVVQRDVPSHCRYPPEAQLCARMPSTDEEVQGPATIGKQQPKRRALPNGGSHHKSACAWGSWQRPSSAGLVRQSSERVRSIFLSVGAMGGTLAIPTPMESLDWALLMTARRRARYRKRAVRAGPNY
jgi:hypothetical protein